MILPFIAPFQYLCAQASTVEDVVLCGSPRYDCVHQIAAQETRTRQIREPAFCASRQKAPWHGPLKRAPKGQKFD